ncbi:hypothetical protein G7Z17_g7127 [Cylindrodendrum hubeiense]|uniref:HMG box domain-containing protein n=1 Tax=Cylindrodendrum hubeiense TaxID=595255 RepID=A0A9P5L7M6_9HYPO|nr:hypothetical protein G7Z17_g7127 [Cylindrodendrum hubeiense]
MRPRAEIPEAELELPRDVPITFVTTTFQGDVNVFLPETFDIRCVHRIAMNFSKSRCITILIARNACNTPPPESKVVYWDSDSSEAEPEPQPEPQPEPHIPRPRNKWIMYRQAKSQEIAQQNSGITAAEIYETPDVKAYWQALAEEEDLRHKAQYPDYKFTTKKKTT